MKRTVWFRLRESLTKAPLATCPAPGYISPASDLHGWIEQQTLHLWRTRPERKLFSSIEAEFVLEFTSYAPEEAVISVTGEITDEDLMYLMLKYDARLPAEDGILQEEFEKSI